MDMTHGRNVLGSVQDIRTMGDFLYDRGIYFIVDGAQVSGHVPINLRGLPVDAYVFTGHKGLFGIMGTGGFYLRDPESISPDCYECGFFGRFVIKSVLTARS